MQESTPAIPHWAFQVLQAIGYLGLGGAVVKFYELYQNRKRPQVEIHKTEAETTEIVVRSQVAASDALDRIVGRLEAALSTTDRLRNERDDLREQNDKQGMELESYERQMKRMKAMMDLRGIRLSDFDEPRS
jgi:hypothetical protein